MSEIHKATKTNILISGLLVNTIITTREGNGHNIDFLKGRVAFDLEWNSKDQTFDRDLF